MNIALRVLQVLLALAFFGHGCLLLFPPAAIVDQMNASLPRWFQLFLGVAEILTAADTPERTGLTGTTPRWVPCFPAIIRVTM